LKRDPRNELHPTQKPICLAERAIRNHSAKTVIDFFCGSGSTIIASESLNRKCYAIEIEPRYVDVAVRRWQNYTGKKGKNLTRPGVEIP
jgi:DNA modification methylase